MSRSGTLVICVQNLDFSGANQVILNIVAGKIHGSNVVISSPKNGSFGRRFIEFGAAVRIGGTDELLENVRDIFCIICNTIMTADIVVQTTERKIPTIWILHEWWDEEMISEQLKMRNYQDLTLETVKNAMTVATRVVCVCESQKQLYKPKAPTSIIYVGVPDPLPRQKRAKTLTVPESPESLQGLDSPEYIPQFEPENQSQSSNTFTFLCLGIVCPRKNQVWTVELFKQFAVGKPNVRLQIVGARYSRSYEIEYLEKVKEAIGDDQRIKLHDATDNVDEFYQFADCVILTSLNEVTPMVIVEALSRGIPVLSTNIAGIKEIFRNGIEGFMFEPGDNKRAVRAMEVIYSNEPLRRELGYNGRTRFETMFDLNAMVESYRHLVIQAAPPVILLDMDGTLVDWDKGFMKEWNNRHPIDRSLSYYMEKCFNHPEFQKQAEEIFLKEGFFSTLEWMEGAKEAILEMEQDGFQLLIVTSPLRQSRYCAQEKIEWVRSNLGDLWLDKLILCNDKSKVSGDLLVDDNPTLLPSDGRYTTANWKQIVFDAPYNRELKVPRLNKWSNWRRIIYPTLGNSSPTELFDMEHSIEELVNLKIK